MKCDELKPLVFSINDLAYVDEIHAKKNFDNIHDHAVYKATEVDAAIAELKAKLESVQASMYADNVDLGMKLRKTQCALWLARAMRANDSACKILRDAGIMFAIGNCRGWDKLNTLQKKWQIVADKCRKKAEEYK